MVEDVWHVDALGMCDGRPIGLLWLSPDCFPSGTLVLTSKGYQPIEEIAVGDRVLTHKGRWRRVTEASRSHRPLMTLRGQGHPGLRVSPEHPFYVRQRNVRWDNDRRQDVPTYDDPSWQPASLLGPGAYRYTYENGRRACLTGGWYWAAPAKFDALQVPEIGGRGHPMSPELMWLAGRYLGDGWTRRTDERAELVITCGHHETEGLRALLARWPRSGARCWKGELAWHERDTETAHQFSTSHQGLVDWLREQFGHRAEAKGMPAWALGMPRELRQSLLDGYVSADGHTRGNIIMCSTVSKALAFGVKALVTSLGFAPTVYFSEQNSTSIAGRTISARPVWGVRWRTLLSRKQVFADDNHLWSAIRERLEPTGSEDVFNIGVDEDESYVVEGVVVHNCKHFSKAKGGKPREKAIRGLAWVGLRWVKSLPKRQRPRIVILENVEEFQDWGPLLEDGRPCPVQKGATFKAFIGGFASLGYQAEWRELRACDYGDPTIRKRLFVILRRDKLPIVWPARTHGNPKDAADAEMIAVGALKPWRTAAEIIDFSLPCPSIFETSAEIKSSLGLRANRPLADNTLSRVAKGTMRYVVNAARPFIVKVNHTERGRARVRAIDEPLACLTGKRDDALVMPFVSYAQQGGGIRDVGEPLHTITASAKDQNAVVTPFITKFNRGAVGHALDEPLATVTSHASETHGGGAAPLGLVAPVLIGCGGRAGQSEPRPSDEPVLTQTTKADACVVMPFLVPRYGERPGQEPRTRSLEEPAPVIVPTGNEGALAAVHLSRQFGASVGGPVDAPAGTVTAGGAGKTAVVAAFLAQHNTDRGAGIKPGRALEEPVSTITATGGQSTVVAAYLAQHNTGEIGHEVDTPVSTIVGKGCTQGLVQASFLSHAYTSNTAGGNGDLERPLKTTLAGGQHAALVAAFLAKYYGAGDPSQAVDEPLHTLTTKPRHGLVTVTMDGEPYVITDIGMRMLTPRERFSAQGFRPDYTIDHGLLEDGSKVLFTLEQQGRMCGNSVCPGMARALVAANVVAKPTIRRAKPERPYPLLEAAE